MDLGERLLPDHQPMVHGVAPEGHHPARHIVE